MSKNTKRKARWDELENQNLKKFNDCRNKNCITPQIKKYCRPYLKKTVKKYRKGMQIDPYTDCFHSNLPDIMRNGIYESLTKCNRKHACYKIDKSVEDEMKRLKKQMEMNKPRTRSSRNRLKKE